MIKNFVEDIFLKTIYPDITDYKNAGILDYSTTIQTAYEMVVDDVENRGLDSRKCHVPIDLNKLSTDSAFQYLKSKTLTADGVSEAFEAKRERRFVINVSAKASGLNTFNLQGSNEASEPEASSTYWTTISTLTWDADEATGEKSIKFSDKYKWYRLSVETSVSVTFTASVYETLWDFIIAYKTFINIFSAWSGETNDWIDIRKKDVLDKYEELMATAKINYDSDDSGTPDTEIATGGSIGSIPIWS
jgi:hypothetical protein